MSCRVRWQQPAQRHPVRRRHQPGQLGRPTAGLSRRATAMLARAAAPVPQACCLHCLRQGNAPAMRPPAFPACPRLARLRPSCPGLMSRCRTDPAGRLIGINTAIADPTGKGASSGIGFAIPIDTGERSLRPGPRAWAGAPSMRHVVRLPCTASCHRAHHRQNSLGMHCNASLSAGLPGFPLALRAQCAAWWNRS